MRRLSACFAVLVASSLTTSAFAFQDPSPSIPQGPPMFRAKKDTVLVRATVTDPLNRFVIGLDREHFRLFEDKVEQDIDYFSNDKSPISVGFILDISGS
ncbi:MAG: VWA domain-containing protein, partial [Acidobacteriota bacterium]